MSVTYAKGGYPPSEGAISQTWILWGSQVILVFVAACYQLADMLSAALPEQERPCHALVLSKLDCCNMLCEWVAFENSLEITVSSKCENMIACWVELERTLFLSASNTVWAFDCFQVPIQSRLTFAADSHVKLAEI